MSALNVALNTIDAAAAEGDLAAHRLMAEQLELEAAGEPRRAAQLRVRLRSRRCWLPPIGAARAAERRRTGDEPLASPMDDTEESQGPAGSCPLPYGFALQEASLPF